MDTQATKDLIQEGVEDIYVNFSPKQFDNYFDELASNILLVSKIKPYPAVVFMSRKDHCVRLAEEFNKRSGLGDKGLKVMTSDTPMDERLRIQSDIRKGDAFGYVTVGVGAEAIDVPNIGVVHLTVNTKSDIKSVQQIGRAQRYYEGKKDVTVVSHCSTTSVRTAYPNLIGVYIPRIKDLLQGVVPEAKAKIPTKPHGFEEEEGCTLTGEGWSMVPQTKDMVTRKDLYNRHYLAKQATVKQTVDAIVTILKTRKFPMGSLFDEWEELKTGNLYNVVPPRFFFARSLKELRTEVIMHMRARYAK
jgi:superfamily II DNA/RNA helicase